MRTLRCAVVLVAIASSTGGALAGPRDHQPPVDEAGGTVEPVTAQDWLALGLRRFDDGDYAGAIDAFGRGHAIDPRPQFLFAIAQAERLRGDCKTALVYYRRFLTTSPPEEQEAAAQQHLRRCSAVVSAAQPDPEPAPAAPPPPPPPVPEPEAPPFWTDPVTLGVGGGALALLLTGGGFLIAADDAASEAASAPSYDEHAQMIDRAESRQRIGIVTLSAGAVLAGYAVYRIIRGGEAPRREERRAIEVAPGPGVGLALGGRF